MIHFPSSDFVEQRWRLFYFKNAKTYTHTQKRTHSDAHEEQIKYVTKWLATERLMFVHRNLFCWTNGKLWCLNHVKIDSAGVDDRASERNGEEGREQRKAGKESSQSAMAVG